MNHKLEQCQNNKKLSNQRNNHVSNKKLILNKVMMMKVV